MSSVNVMPPGVIPPFAHLMIYRPKFNPKIESEVIQVLWGNPFISLSTQNYCYPSLLFTNSSNPITFLVAFWRSLHGLSAQSVETEENEPIYSKMPFTLPLRVLLELQVLI